MAPSATPISVIQYGCRDDDDDSLDGSRHGARRGSKFIQKIAKRTSSKGSMKKVKNMIHETKSLLKGANVLNVHNNHAMYGYNSDEELSDDDEEYSSSSDSSESSADSDDASVSSKASVASKLKKLGGKIKRGSIRVVAGKKVGTHIKQDDNDDDDQSVSSTSSTKSAAQRVKKGLSKALKALGPSGGGGHIDDLSDSEVEEDLFAFPSKSCHGAPTKSSRMMVQRSKSFDESTPKGMMFRRSTNTPSCPNDVAPTKQTPRRHASEGKRRNTVSLDHLKTYQSSDDDDSDLSDLSGDEGDDSPPTTTKKKVKKSLSKATSSKAVYTNNWSMNVTPDMLEHTLRNI